MKEKIISEINIVPYVDVMLVLLVIFMLASPMVNKYVDVDVPEVENNDSLMDLKTEDSIIVSVTKSGDIKIDGVVKTYDEIEKMIEKDKSVNIAADKDIIYGDLLNIMIEFKNRGYKKVALTVEVY